MSERWCVVLGSGLVGVVMALASGCKPATCESVCEQQNTCPDAQQIPDCATYCDAERATVEATGCQESYDALLSCQGTVSSCDQTSTFCSAQTVAHLQCISDACAEDPTKCSGG
jgi:hypothetical protein